MNTVPMTPAGGGNMKKILIIIIILAVVAALVFVLINKNKDDGSTNQTVAEEDNGFPEVFYSYKGTITKMDDNKIIMMANAGENYLTKDTEMTVLINDATEVNKIKVATKAEIESGTAKLIDRTSANISDLSIGDEIVVIAAENLNGKTQFTALKIEMDK